MHKVFGVRKMVNYIDRVGVYLRLIKDGKVDALLEDDMSLCGWIITNWWIACISRYKVGH